MKKVVETLLRRFVEMLDYVFLLRPTLWYPVWIFFIAGFWGNQQGNGSSVVDPVSSFAILALLTGMMGAVYILNQLQDVETDRANQKLFIIANGLVSGKQAIGEAVGLTALALAGAFVLDLTQGVLFLVVFVITGILYNFPPSRWKDRPIMGMLVNGLGCVLIYTIGWMCVRAERGIPMQAWLYGLAGISVSLNTTLPDMEGDSKAGKRTFTVAYGVEATAIAALVMEVLTVGWALYLKEWLLLVPAGLVLPLFIWAAIQRTKARVMFATKVSILALALAVCVVFPWLLLPIFGVFLLSKYYYRKRFNLNYPTLKNG